MKYKTIVLELLEQRPELYERLRSQQQLLTTLDRYALELKTNHESLKDSLAQARPGSDSMQIGSEALEIAIQELIDRLDCEAPSSE